MFKTISAALIATSLLAAPAMSATIVVKPSVANSRAQVVVVKKHRHHNRYGFHKHRHGHGHKVVIVKKHRHHL